MTALDYFKAKADAYISPMALKALIDSDPGSVAVVDVRMGPRPTKIKGAIDMPEGMVTTRMVSCQRISWWCYIAGRRGAVLLRKPPSRCWRPDSGSRRCMEGLQRGRH